MQLKLHFDSHPKVRELGYETLEMKLWVALAEAGLLVGPGLSKVNIFCCPTYSCAGNMFSANPSGTSASNPGHFRISFSTAKVTNIASAGALLKLIPPSIPSSRT